MQIRVALGAGSSVGVLAPGKNALMRLPLSTVMERRTGGWANASRSTATKSRRASRVRMDLAARGRQKCGRLRARPTGAFLQVLQASASAAGTGRRESLLRGIPVFRGIVRFRGHVCDQEGFTRPGALA